MLKENPDITDLENYLSEEFRSNSSMTFIYGRARSATTILEISLGQAADLTYSQPFTSTLQELTGGTNAIIDEEVYKQALMDLSRSLDQVKEETGKNSVSVVVKEVNGRLSPAFLERWLKIPNYTVLAIRDPLIQTMSLMRQKAIGIFHLDAPPPRGEFSQDMMTVIEDSIVNDGLETPYLQFQEEKWQTFQDDLRIMERLGVQHGVLDTTLMRLNPSQSLANLYNAMGIGEVDIDSCVSGFSSNQIRFFDKMDRNRDTVRKAYQSDSILPVNDTEAVQMSTFSRRAQDSLRRILPVYTDFMLSSSNVYLPSPTEMRDQALGAKDGVTLSNAHPVTYGAAMLANTINS